MKMSAQKGFVDPKIIIGGIVVLAVILFIATGNLKFSASITDNSKSKPTTSENTKTAEATPQPTSKPKTYQSEANKISMEYPADWSLKENPAAGYIAGFISPKQSANDTFQENLGVKAIDISSQPNITLQEVADTWENQTKKSESTFSVSDRKSSTVSGESAKDIVYTFKDQGDNGKGMTRITLKNKKAYIFQYNALEKDYDKFLPAIETILSSLKFN